MPHPPAPMCVFAQQFGRYRRGSRGAPRTFLWLTDEIVTFLSVAANRRRPKLPSCPTK